MATFLSILKIIGIVLLVALAVLLVLILLVLFVPIRYAVDARIDETDFGKEADKLKDNIYAKASFHWLLYLVRGSIEYPDDLNFKVKVLFFQVFPSKKENKEVSGNDLEDKKAIKAEMEDLGDLENKTDDQTKEEASEDKTSSDQGSTNDESMNNDRELNEAFEKNDSGEGADDEEPKEDDFDNEEEDDKSFLDTLHNIFSILCDIVKIPQNVLKKIQCTISSIYAKINMIKNTLTNDIFKRAFEVTKKQVFRVLKMILPKKCKINLLVGMEDVAATADIFSAYGILYPLLVGKVYMQPDFERQVIGGNVYIRGRIRIFTIIWAAAVLYFNKDVKKTIRRFRKIMGS